MEKIVNRGDRDVMLSAMDKVIAASQKFMTEEDRTVVAEKIAEIRTILETYIPHGLN